MYAFNPEELQAEYESHSVKKQAHLKALEQAVLESGEALEGNSFYVHTTLNLYPALYTKQQNLYWCGKQGLTRMCEIGFNAGHSTMLMLLGRETTPLDFTIFDIGHHRYVRPSLSYIQSAFPHIRFEYIEGDSTKTMPTWIQAKPQHVGSYDVVHVDGGHSEHCITNDMKNADLLVKAGGIVIVDDTSMGHINNCVNEYLASGKYKEVNVLKTQGYPHRILQKI
jgi:hypothetical protein